MPQGIDVILRVALAVIGAYAVAFWFSLVVWTFRDVQKRTRDVLVQVLATMLVLLFNLPGLFLYTILRPPETLSEAYARALEEESLIQDIEERQACPKCKHRIEPDYLVCPSCGTRLKQLCTNCQRIIHLGWETCPYCARPVPEPADASIADDEAPRVKRA